VILTALPFVLRFSKDERRVFQQNQVQRSKFKVEELRTRTHKPCYLGFSMSHSTPKSKLSAWAREMTKSRDGSHQGG